jgi:DNA integrity scanning protein DisA with diadenylate cyclase activity
VHLLSIIADLRFQDALDILFLTLVAYYLYRWFWGTKAFQALVGLLALGLVFTLARTWGLFLTTWVFQILWQVLVLLLIILFQSEIRQALERVNPLQALGLRKRANHGKWIQPFSEAAFSMAEKRIGALLIIQRVDKTEEWITLGEQVEGKPSPELLLSIFQKGSPLHDGAVLIKDGHIAYVAETLAPLRPAKKTWQERVRSLFLFQWKAKGGALLLVMIFWLLFAGQQNFEITLTLPVELKNIPERMEVVQPKNLKARIRVSGLRKDVSTLSDKNVQVDLDLSAAVGGKKTFQITRDEVHLPSERIQILNIDPAQVTFKFRQTPGT